MSDVEAQLAAATEACGQKLREKFFSEIVGLLGPLGQPDRAFELLSGITVHPKSGAELARICASIPSEPGLNAVERALLMLASRHAIALVPGLAVSDSVKVLFAEEFQSFASPPAAWVSRFRSDDVRYREMARIATLRRFPAGQFHWEVSGFPRSWVGKANQPLKLLAHVLGRMGGFRPVFELHVNDRRRNRLVLLEREANISYCRAARSMEKQPEVRGLMTASWLFCETTAEVTPRMAWLRRTPLSGGAMIFDLAPAPADSGFMTGSEERRKLYEEGAYRPTIACVLWPRKSLIEWANRHPEFDL